MNATVTPRQATASRVLPPLIGAVVVMHGLIHLLGAVTGFGWAEVPALSGVTGSGDGLLWLGAGVLVTAAGLGLLLRRRRWWVLGAMALVTSQTAVVTDWSEAQAGTLVNALLLLAVLHGWLAEGPRSMRERYRRGVAAALDEQRHHSARSGVVTEADLSDLPAQVATYLRRTGAVGRPRVTGFQAQIHGRIRSGPTAPWMTFTGEQVNTYSPTVSRHFLLDASRAGLPVDVLHVLNAGRATMHAAVCSAFPVARGTGPEMDRAETVTLFNDLCIMAPASLITAPVEWKSVDAHRVRGSYTNGQHTVSAELLFDDDGDLVDFVSDDRFAIDPGGKSFTRRRWSTPVGDYQLWNGRRLASRGSGVWHAPAPDGTFAYLEMTITDVVTDSRSSAGLREVR